MSAAEKRAYRGRVDLENPPNLLVVETIAAEEKQFGLPSI
jgi:hypothetical protein